jgi:uncharacterized protein YndB with AHSA1/START domain
MNNTTERSEAHATFTIDRTMPAPIERVWHALSDNEARTHWFGGGDEFHVDEQSHDFRVGGAAVESGRWKGGPTSRFESVYTDIVPMRRIVFTYDMWVDGGHLSTSLTSIVVEPDGDETRLTYTEHGIHFDGLDSAEGREEGTRGILENLAAFVERG